VRRPGEPLSLGPNRTAEAARPIAEGTQGGIAVPESRHSGAASALVGPIWFMGWLFTIGYTHLHLWKAVLALIIWPYYLGTALAGK